MSGEYAYAAHDDAPADLRSVLMGSAGGNARDGGAAEGITSATSAEFSLRVADDNDAGDLDTSQVDFPLLPSSDEVTSPTATPQLDSPSPPVSMQPSLTQSKSRSGFWGKSAQSARSWRPESMELVNLASAPSGASLPTNGSRGRSTQSNPYADVLPTVDGAVDSVNNSMDSRNLLAMSHTVAGGHHSSTENVRYSGSFANGAALVATTSVTVTPPSMRRLSQLGGLLSSHDLNTPTSGTSAAVVVRRSSNASLVAQGRRPSITTTTTRTSQGSGRTLNSRSAAGSGRVASAGTLLRPVTPQTITADDASTEPLSLSIQTSVDFPVALPTPPPEQLGTAAATGSGNANAARLPHPPTSPAASRLSRSGRANAAGAAPGSGSSAGGPRTGPAPTFLGVPADNEDGATGAWDDYRTFFESMGWRGDSSPSAARPSSLTRVRSDDSLHWRAASRRAERSGSESSSKSPTVVLSESPTGSPAGGRRRASSEPSANGFAPDDDLHGLLFAAAQPTPQLSSPARVHRSGRRVRGACDEGYDGDRPSVGTAFTRERTGDFGDAVGDSDDINLAGSADRGDDYGGLLSPRNAAQARLLHHLTDQPSLDSASSLQNPRSLAGRALVKPLSVATTAEPRAQQASQPPQFPAAAQSRPTFALAPVRMTTSAALTSGPRTAYAFNRTAAADDNGTVDSLSLSTSLSNTLRLSRTTAFENSLSLSSRMPRPPSRHMNKASLLGDVVRVDAQCMPTSPHQNGNGSSASASTAAAATTSASSSAVIDLTKPPRSRGTRPAGSGAAAAVVAASAPPSVVAAVAATATSPGTSSTAPTESSANRTSVAASQGCATPRSSKNELLHTTYSTVRIRTSLDRDTTRPSSTPGAPWPLAKAGVSIVVRRRMFDPMRRRLRGPRTRSLPNGRPRANWTAPETHYTTTLADLATFEEEMEESEESEEEEQQQQPQPHAMLGEDETVMSPMAAGAYRFAGSAWQDQDIDVDVPPSSTSGRHTTWRGPAGATPALPKGVGDVTSAASPRAGSHTARTAPTLPAASAASPMLRTLATGTRKGPPPMASFSPITLSLSPEAHHGAVRDSLNTSTNNSSRRPTGIVVDEVEKVHRLREEPDFTPVLDDLASEPSPTRTRGGGGGGTGSITSVTAAASPLAGQERRTSRRPFTPLTGLDSGSARAGATTSGRASLSDSNRPTSSTSAGTEYPGADPYGLLTASASNYASPTFARIIGHRIGGVGDLDSARRPISARVAESGAADNLEERRSVVTFAEPPSLLKAE